MPSTSSTRRSGIPVVAASARRWLRAERCGYGSRLEEGAELDKRSGMLRELTPVDGGTTLARIVESEDHAHGGRLPAPFGPRNP